MTLHLTRRFLYLFYFILFLLGEERDSGKFLVDIDAPCSIPIDRTHSTIFSMSNIDKLKLWVVNPNSPVSSTHDASWLKMAWWTPARYARLFKVNDFLNFISFLLHAGSIVSKVIEFARLIAAVATPVLLRPRHWMLQVYAELVARMRVVSETKQGSSLSAILYPSIFRYLSLSFSPHLSVPPSSR